MRKRKLTRALLIQILSTARVAFLLLLLLAQTAAAQDYEAYHRDINHAEKCFVTGKIDSALWYYDQAFAAYNFIFAKDAFIAAQICWKNKTDSQKTGQYLMKGAENGLQTSCLTQSIAILSYLNTPEYLLLEPELKKARLRFNRGIDTSLRKEWQMRFDAEQAAKNLPRSNRNNFLRYKEQVERNVASIISLWQKRHIYPGDQITGLLNDCETMSNTNAFYSLAHYDCMATTLDSMLWPAVRLGFLHPRDYAALWQFERLRTESISPSMYTNPACKTCIRSLCKFNLAWFKEKNRISLKEVERNREEFWLCEEQTDQALQLLEQSEGYKLRFGYR
jgi:hypothetical protein